MDEQQEISPEEFVAFATQGRNIAGDLSDEQIAKIAQDVLSDYELDKDSMSDWRGRMEKAIDLAKLVKDEKSYPFEGAANIKYPLVTTAALQFNARAYPAICPADDPVKAKVWGEDRSGRKAARGMRCSAYMSWQLSAEIEEWEAETDKLTLQLPIVGDMFRKWWWDEELGRARCRLIEPGAYIVNANAQTLHLAPRGTEEVALYPYQIKEKINSGWFVEFDYDTTGEDEQSPHDFIEQNTRLDLDEDGYPEPWIVTVHCETQTVVRIVADFTPDDVTYDTRTVQVPRQVVDVVPDEMGQPVQVPRVVLEDMEVKTGIRAIRRYSYVEHFQFMPGMDGGLFGTGLGVLLSDISAAVNTAFNMLIDAGHYSSLGGGFIGGDFRLKGGNNRMRPGEWKNVPASGQTVRESMVPLAYPGPDQTLFAMLGMLIDAGKEISSTKDILTGETERNQTATTTLALIEQGMKVFTAVYKRIFRSLKREYKLLAGLNATYLTPEEYNQFLDDTDEAGRAVMHDPQADFGAADNDIQPVADPEAVTRMQEMAKAQLVMEMAQGGLLDQQAGAMRVLEAAAIPDVEELMPKPNPAQEAMEQMGVQAAQADLAQKMADLDLTMAKVEQARADAFAKVAGVEGDARAQRFDEAMRVLETQRDDLARSLDEIRRGMAGASGDGSPRRSVQRPVGRPQAGVGGGVHGGPAIAGIGIGQGGGPDGFRIA